MQFEFTDPQTPLEKLFGGFYSINAFGRIEPGDGARFRRFLDVNRPPPITCVYLNTSGGSVHDGIEIGRLIRFGSFTTSIGTYTLASCDGHDIITRRQFTPGICASAGTLAFLGGRFRWVPKESSFRVHRFFFKGSMDKVLGPAQETFAAIARYIQEMGVDLRLMEVSSAVDHRNFLDLSGEELDNLGITLALGPVQWSVESRNNSLYVRVQRDTIYGLHKMMLGHFRDGGFYLHAVCECQGREQELKSHPLVEVTLNREMIRWNVSERAIRQVVNGYMIVMILVSPEEANQSAT